MEFEQKVIVFYPEDRENVLDFCLRFRTGDGRNSWKTGTISNTGFKTAEQMRDAILKHTTEFVRQNWFLLEVTTPLRNDYGTLTGGYRRLKMTRSEVATA